MSVHPLAPRRQGDSGSGVGEHGRGVGGSTVYGFDVGFRSFGSGIASGAFCMLMRAMRLAPLIHGVWGSSFDCQGLV